jgi:hypothetical protein
VPLVDGQLTRAPAVLRLCWNVLLTAWSLALCLLMFTIWVLIAGDSDQGEATNPSPWPAFGVVAAVTAVLGLAFAVVNRRLKRHQTATRLDDGV